MTAWNQLCNNDNDDNAADDYGCDFISMMLTIIEKYIVIGDAKNT